MRGEDAGERRGEARAFARGVEDAGMALCEEEGRGGERDECDARGSVSIE